MKFNKLVLLLLVVFILTSSTSIIFAQEVKVSDISFDVPGNYSVNKTTDDSCLLKSNLGDNHTINVILSESSDSILEKNSRKTSGFDFLAEENYTSDNNISINKQDFIKNESFFSFYSFKFDNSSYLIIYTFPTVGELKNDSVNPVEELINSIH